MIAAVPERLAIVVLGPSGGALGCRLRDLLPGAQLHGPRAHAGDWDEAYDRVIDHIAGLFADHRPILGVCASGILIRAVSPLLADKHAEPPVVAVAEDGSVAVPLLGGHHGANALARRVADMLGGIAAVTTAGDVRLGLTLDEPPSGWRIAEPAPVKTTAAALLASRPVALLDEMGWADWLRCGGVAWADGEAALRIIVTDRAQPRRDDTLVYHPPVLALGIGCERGCDAEDIAALARRTLAEAGLAPEAVAAVVSHEIKLREPGVHALADALGVPARFFSAPRLLAETDRLSERSETVFRTTGCWGVAEGAALAAAGAGGSLLVTKQRARRATCAVARAARPIDASAIGRGRGSLSVIGIGPGDPAWRTGEANAALAQASDVVGYRLYLDLLGRALVGKRRHDGALGAEEARVRLALDLAAEGRHVALVSSGDAGIYGLAALVFELLDREKRGDWQAVELTVCPGVSAMHAAAARAGAPLGHDFCAISLSDLMTPWTAIQARVAAAAAADFVVALYNPRSQRRATRLTEAATILLRHRPPETPVFVARNLGRDGEQTAVLTLAELPAADADMLTIVIVGNRQTRRVGDPPRLYTPRGYFDPGRR